MSEEYPKCPPTAKLISMVHSLRQELELTRRALEEATGGVCEWTRREDIPALLTTSCSDRWLGVLFAYDGQRYCTYCGKRLVVKEG